MWHSLCVGAIWATIGVALVLAAVVGFGALRMNTDRKGPTITMGLFMLAIALAIIAIASVTFFRKTTGA
jgi:hypothetical protein